LRGIVRRASGTLPNGLRFPSNGDSPSSEFVAFQFANPQSNGLPFNGPSGAGWTIIWEIYLRQHTGYYVTWWWGNNGAFDWKSPGVPAAYVGGHPYPRDPGAGDRENGTVHDWELAGLDLTGGTDHDGDNLDTIAGPTKLVVKDRWYTQALRVTDNGDGTASGRFWIDLPSTSNSDIIVATSANGYFDTNPPSPCFTFGDSPWAQSVERMSGTLRRVKIIAKSITESDVVTEGNDMSALKTTDGQNQIWWGKTDYSSVDDLTCNYGTGRAFSWANSNKATLVAT
jgi:hypothetical protein